MSFLDHLEELRSRLFKALGAVTLGFIAGWFLVERFGVVQLLKAPIAPFLPDGKLVVLSPTEPLWIVLKLSFITGCVLASPVVLWQVWAFLSPALYARERTGRGQRVETSLLGSMMALQQWELSHFFLTGLDSGPGGRGHPLRPGRREGRGVQGDRGGHHRPRGRRPVRDPARLLPARARAGRAR